MWLWECMLNSNMNHFCKKNMRFWFALNVWIRLSLKIISHWKNDKLGVTKEIRGNINWINKHNLTLMKVE